MLTIPKFSTPIIEIPTESNVRLFLKREDQIHPHISGNKYWKLFHNVNNYLSKGQENPLIITFGGAFSNHIASVAAFGKEFGIPTLGIIRGDELEEKWSENSTLSLAAANGMQLRFVSRKIYQDKIQLTKSLTQEFPEALLIEEGGTNELAVEGIQQMLTEETKDFNYLCAAVGTGGTLAGISKFCEDHQLVLGINVVQDESLEDTILKYSERRNFTLIPATEKYGKITDEIVHFINEFDRKHHIPLDPIYTAKMMFKLFKMIDEGYFPDGSKILAFHTGGLQGIKGANRLLAEKNRDLIRINA